MQLLDEHLFNLYKSQLIAPEEAVDKARNPGDMQDKIEADQKGIMLQTEEDKTKEEKEPDIPKGPKA